MESHCGLRTWIVCSAVAVACCRDGAAAPPSHVNVAGLADLVTTIHGDDTVALGATAPAGDVDGDGLSDLLLRFSPRGDIASQTEQVVLLYGGFEPGGRLDPFAPEVRTSVVNLGGRTNPDYVDSDIPSPIALAGGEDVDGDGRPDVLIASRYEFEVDRDTILLIRGGPLPAEIRSFQIGDEVPGSFIIDTGTEREVYLGSMVALTEDLDGDGLGEIVVADPGKGSRPGRVAVVFGMQEAPLVIDLAEIGEKVPGFVFETQNHWIEGVASLGDVDGDGLAELGVSASLRDLSGPRQYSSFIIFGRRRFPATIETSAFEESDGVVLPGFKEIQAAGDINDDGYADVLLELHDAANFAPARTFFLEGYDRGVLPAVIDEREFRELFLGSILQEPYDATGGGVGVGTTAPRFSLAGGRDLDGDGQAEVLLGTDAAHVVVGPAVAAFGGSAYLIDPAALPLESSTGQLSDGRGIRFDGLEPQGALGESGFLPGDVDGDGLGELALISSLEACESSRETLVDKLWLVSGGVLDPQPRLGRVYPEEGASDGGTQVLLLGAGFDESPRVYFGEKESPSVNVLSSGVLIAESPAAPPGLVAEVRVETAGGIRTEGLPYTYSSGRTLPLEHGARGVMELGHASTQQGSTRGAAMGDFNGDGQTDLALLDHRVDIHDGAALHLVLGTGTRTGTIDLDPPRPGVSRITGGVARLASVASGGDLDGDGRDDLVLRVSLGRERTEVEWRVLLGRAAFPAESTLDSIEGTVTFASGTGMLQPGAMAIVPDVSGDRFDELLLAGWTGERTLLFVVKGSEAFSELDVDLDVLAEEGHGGRLEADIDLTGAAGAAGDFNQDGIDDLFFAGRGAFQEGAVAVLYGSPFLFTPRTVLLRREFFGDAGGLLVAGTSLFSGFLFSAAIVDIDGDGDQDLYLRQDDFGSCTLASRAGRGVISDRAAMLAAGMAPEAELVRSFFESKFTGPPDFIPGEPGTQPGVVWLEHTIAGEGLGVSSSAAGDFDGDGFADLLLGAPGASTFLRGSSYLLRGGSDFYSTSQVRFPEAGTQGIQILPPEDTRGFGQFVLGGFDWDEDGADDLLIAASDGRTTVIFADIQGQFVRGNANSDRTVDLSDAVFILAFLFLGVAEPSCKDASDADDTGNIEITDAIYLLSHLFLGGPPPPPPFPEEGEDPTEDDLECR